MFMNQMLYELRLLFDFVLPSIFSYIMIAIIPYEIILIIDIELHFENKPFAPPVL